MRNCKQPALWKGQTLSEATLYVHCSIHFKYFIMLFCFLLTPLPFVYQTFFVLFPPPTLLFESYKCLCSSHFYIFECVFNLITFYQYLYLIRISLLCLEGWDLSSTFMCFSAPNLSPLLLLILLD